MSEVMKALRQSEQGYQNAQPQQSLTDGSAGQRKNRGQWSLFMAIILLPAVCSVSYQVYQAQQAWQEKLDQAHRLQQQAEQMAQQPVEPQVTYLDYPDFGELTPLAEFSVKQKTAGTTTAETETKIISGEALAAPVTVAMPEEAMSAEPEEAMAEQEEPQWDLSQLDLSQLSPEMARRVQNIQQQSVPDYADTGADIQEPAQPAIKLIDHQSELKDRLPAMNLQHHIYSDNEQNRWVKINDHELHEGEWLDSRVKLLSIRQRFIVVEFEGQQIEIPALYEWDG